MGSSIFRKRKIDDLTIDQLLAELDDRSQYYVFLHFENYLRYRGQVAENGGLSEASIYDSFKRGVNLEKRIRGLDKPIPAEETVLIKKLEAFYTKLYFGGDKQGQKFREEAQKQILANNSYLKDLEDKFQTKMGMSIFQKDSLNKLNPDLFDEKNQQKLEEVIEEAGQNQKSISKRFIEKAKRLIDKYQRDIEKQKSDDLLSRNEKKLKQILAKNNNITQSMLSNLSEIMEEMINQEAENNQIVIQASSRSKNEDLKKQLHVVKKKYLTKMTEETKSSLSSGSKNLLSSNYDNTMKNILQLAIAFSDEVGFKSYVIGLLGEESANLLTMMVDEAYINGANELYQDFLQNATKELGLQGVKVIPPKDGMLVGSKRDKAGQQSVFNSRIEDEDLSYYIKVASDHVSKIDLSLQVKVNNKKYPLNFSIKNYDDLSDIHIVKGTGLDEVITSFRYGDVARYHILNLIAGRTNEDKERPLPEKYIDVLNQYYYIVALNGYFANKSANYLFLISNNQVRILSIPKILSFILGQIEHGNNLIMKSNLDQDFIKISQQGEKVEIQGADTFDAKGKIRHPTVRDEAIITRNMNIYKEYIKSRVDVTINISKYLLQTEG